MMDDNDAPASPEEILLLLKQQKVMIEVQEENIRLLKQQNELFATQVELLQERVDLVREQCLTPSLN